MLSMAEGSSQEDQDPVQRHHGTGSSSPCQGWRHTGWKMEREGGGRDGGREQEQSRGVLVWKVFSP